MLGKGKALRDIFRLLWRQSTTKKQLRGNYYLNTERESHSKIMTDSELKAQDLGNCYDDSPQKPCYTGFMIASYLAIWCLAQWHCSLTQMVLTTQKLPQNMPQTDCSTSFPTIKLVLEEFLLHCIFAGRPSTFCMYDIEKQNNRPAPRTPQKNIFTDKVHMSLHTFWDCVAFWNRFIRLTTSRNLRKPSMRLSSKETGVLFLSAWGSLRWENGSTRKRAFQ